MNNTFYEGPIQTGKSTLIRELLRKTYGAELTNVAGFTSQRVVYSDGRLRGFCIAPADADILTTTPDGPFFKEFATNIQRDNYVDRNDEPDVQPSKPLERRGRTKVHMEVFETTGVRMLEDALAKAKTGEVKIILLDEIGGHEMACEKFREKLYEILDSDIPCIGVVKMYESALRMDPSIATLNQELHKKITGVDGSAGEIIYYEREAGC